MKNVVVGVQHYQIPQKSNNPLIDKNAVAVRKHQSEQVKK
jgi:hypothetical protein